MQQQTIGRYQVLEEIASGGQGTVYRAWDTGSGRVVALKVLHPHLASDLGVLERFRREAQLAAAVVHPNITTIYEVGQHGNNHFIAMEYLPDSIHNLIVSTGQLPIDRAVDICRQAAVGLEAASRRGIIHRDIKPQNLLLAPDGTVKVTDFGIARATALSTMTRTGALMGTPHYMSPEQAQGQRVDIRSDIYSLGIVLYQMLTGQLPFDANTPYEVIRQQVEQRPGPVRRLRSNIPGAVERIVNRCLEKNPERRYQSPGDLARALGEAVPGTGRERIRQQQRAPAAPASAPRPPEQPAQRRAERARPNTTRMQSWARAWQKTHRSRWAWFLPVIPILIALVVAAVRLDVVDLSAMGAWIGTGSQPAVQNTPAPPVATPDNGITIPDSQPAGPIAPAPPVSTPDNGITIPDSQPAGPTAAAPPVSTPDMEITIPDLNLRAAIIATLNIAAGEPITAADMATLTELDAPDSFISDLSGLESAINLKVFTLYDNAISDLSPLAGLVNMRHLHFSGNSISDVSPLGGSPNIAYLYIVGNSISDVAPLAGLTQLRELHICDNSISDVSPLAALTNLEELFLSINSISDLTPLVVNPGLGAGDRVNVERNPLSDQSVSQHVPALRARGVDVGVGVDCAATAAQTPTPTEQEVYDPYELGLTVVNISPQIRVEHGLPSARDYPHGVFVLDVDPHGLAHAMGVREHDLITRVNVMYESGDDWREVLEADQFHALIAEGWLEKYGAEFDLATKSPEGVLEHHISRRLRPAWARSGIAAGLLPTPASPSSERCCILLGEPQWESVQVQNRIVQYILEHGYAYQTGLLEGSSVELIQGMSIGQIDLMMEIWLPNQAETWAAAIEAQEIVDLGTSLGSDWQSSFVIPRYLQEQYPELDHVDDLRSPRYQRLFATADSGGKAELVGCVVGWSCWDINRQQVQAYGLDNYVQVTDPGAMEGLYSSIRNAYEKREPWLGYMWGSADPALELDLVRLEEPPYNERCWDAQRSCGFPDSTIFMAGSLKLADSAPEVAEFLKRWSFDFTQWSSIRSWRKANPSSAIEDAAIFWLVQHHSVWTEWVSDDELARGVERALEGGVRAEGWPD